MAAAAAFLSVILLAWLGGVANCVLGSSGGGIGSFSLVGAAGEGDLVWGLFVCFCRR